MLTCAFCGQTDRDVVLVPLSNGTTPPAHEGCATDWEWDRTKDRED